VLSVVKGAACRVVAVLGARRLAECSGGSME